MNITTSKNFPFYWVDQVNYDEIEIYNHKVYKVAGKCWATPSTCVRSVDILKYIKKIATYIIQSTND